MNRLTEHRKILTGSASAGSRPRWGRRRDDETEAMCPIRQFDRLMRVQLAHKIKPVRLDSLDRDAELFGDIAVTRPFGDKLQNLSFTPGQDGTFARIGRGANQHPVQGGIEKFFASNRG